MAELDDKALAKGIRGTEKSRAPIEGKLETDERVLARITEGIYRQPASALRELVSNAYDADATEVVILTDMPRFGQISVRDNGLGLSPEGLTQLVKHIGGSAKRNAKGQELGITSAANPDLSPSGRKLIGKLGIGLFSVAQFTRHFLIITKTKGDAFRTIADITLGRKVSPKGANGEPQHFETGQYRIWRERADDKDVQGTEIKLLDLLPRTRDELASDDLWTRYEFHREDAEAEPVEAPKIHIGRVDRATSTFTTAAALPWGDEDTPRQRFEKLVRKLRSLSNERDSVDLRTCTDNYIWSLWTLALSAPVAYLEAHPFELTPADEVRFFSIENRMRGQAEELELQEGQSPRKRLKLKSPNGATAGQFEVFMDGTQILRPILYRDLPRTHNAVKNPLLFVGKHREEFARKSRELTGGPLEFEAYLFWAPKIIPKQHQGVILRVGNASGALFDPDFMGYETSELTRKSQVSAEIFVLEGLDDAINIDRESFNYAHPHYQFLTKWLHSAFRQFSNRHKDLGKQLRSKRLRAQSARAQENLEKKVEAALKARGIEDVPEVEVIEENQKAEAAKLRRSGKVVLRRDIAIPTPVQMRLTEIEKQRQRLAEKKAIAIAQLLHGMELLDRLSYDEQEKLIRDIMEIVLLNE